MNHSLAYLFAFNLFCTAAIIPCSLQSMEKLSGKTRIDSILPIGKISPNLKEVEETHNLCITYLKGSLPEPGTFQKSKSGNNEMYSKIEMDGVNLKHLSLNTLRKTFECSDPISLILVLAPEQKITLRQLQPRNLRFMWQESVDDPLQALHKNPETISTEGTFRIVPSHQKNSVRLMLEEASMKRVLHSPPKNFPLPVSAEKIQSKIQEICDSPQLYKTLSYASEPQDITVENEAAPYSIKVSFSPYEQKTLRCFTLTYTLEDTPSNITG